MVDSVRKDQRPNQGCTSSKSFANVQLHSLRVIRTVDGLNIVSGRTLAVDQPPLRQSAHERLSRLAISNASQEGCTDTKPAAGHLPAGKLGKL